MHVSDIDLNIIIIRIISYLQIVREKRNKMREGIPRTSV